METNETNTSAGRGDLAPAESCGTHFPAACPAGCQHRGDRFSQAQLRTHLQLTPELSRRERAALAAAWAQRIWPTLSSNEQAGVRFGLFPHAVMLRGEAEGLSSRELAVALMDQAKANGGMRA